MFADFQFWDFTVKNKKTRTSYWQITPSVLILFNLFVSFSLWNLRDFLLWCCIYCLHYVVGKMFFSSNGVWTWWRDHQLGRGWSHCTASGISMRFIQRGPGEPTPYPPSLSAGTGRRFPLWNPQGRKFLTHPRSAQKHLLEWGLGVF